MQTRPCCRNANQAIKQISQLQSDCVKDLMNNLTVAGFTNLGNQAIVGEQMGVLVGSRVL
jgi:hypothetical protein